VGPSKRISSQTATVFHAVDGNKRGSLDLGMHYVNTLGENICDAFPVAGGKENTMSKVVVTTGEEFKFRVNIAVPTGEYRKLEARLTSGQPLPPFLRLDMMGYSGASTWRGAVEFYGEPNSREIGEYIVGVYTVGNTEPIAKVIVKVKGRGI